MRNKKGKMENKNILLIGIGILIAVFLFGLISGQENVYCCEKKIGGGFCEEVTDTSQCTEGLRADRTSCQSTTYCSIGTCITTQTGKCLPSPKVSCNEEGGFWDSRDKYDIPQCQTGCCIIGDQAAVMEQTRCSYLASLPEYDIRPEFLRNIQDENQCLALATPGVKGACVFETESDKSCTIETKQRCQERGLEFHEGFLCTAEDLGTICGKTERTTCVDDKDGVYFVDSCGNIANIYDSNKKEIPADWEDYWTYIKDPRDSSQTCGVGQSNANSASCGNCDFYARSTCGSVERGQNIDMGKNICKSLDCGSFDTNGNGRIDSSSNFSLDETDYKHTERWCAKLGLENAPGREEIRLTCYNGEITAELCGNWRAKTCEESILNKDLSEIYWTRNAQCVVNEWQFCIGQDNQKDCDNEDKGDCDWNEDIEICVPENPPAFNFWNALEDTEAQCQKITRQCETTYKMGGLQRAGAEFTDIIKEKWEVEEESECIEDEGKKLDNKNDSTIKESWVTEQMNLCTPQGDCGVKLNYLEKPGYNSWIELFTGDFKESSFPEIARSATRQS